MAKAKTSLTLVPTASNPLGCTPEDVRKYLADIVEPYFQAWMNGQTMGYDDKTGTVCVYPWDLASFGETLDKVISKAMPHLLAQITD